MAGANPTIGVVGEPEAVQEERECRVKQGKLKKQKPLPPVTDIEKSFEIPTTWEFARIGRVSLTSSGTTPQRTSARYFGGKTPLVKSGEVKQGEIRETEETVT